VRGRSRFTRAEAAAIRSRLGRLRRADPATQKAIRAELRRAPSRFYITDWDDSYAGFTAADFDALVAARRITIIDG
jgi:hypothetical protein